MAEVVSFKLAGAPAGDVAQDLAKSHGLALSATYLHHLARNKDLTGTRLLTLHNLSYVESLVRNGRVAIAARRFAAYADAVSGGAPPWSVATTG